MEGNLRVCVRLRVQHFAPFQTLLSLVRGLSTGTLRIKG